MKFYDLQRPDMEVTQSTQKSRVMAGVWPLNWPVFFTVIDDAYWSSKCGGRFLAKQCAYYMVRYDFADACGIMCVQGLNLGTRPAHLFGCAGPVCDVSFSDWLNTYVFVTDYGEIRAGYCRQLLFNFADNHRRLRAVCVGIGESAFAVRLTRVFCR